MAKKIIELSEFTSMVIGDFSMMLPEHKRDDFIARVAKEIAVQAVENDYKPLPMVKRAELINDGDALEIEAGTYSIFGICGKILLEMEANK